MLTTMARYLPLLLLPSFAAAYSFNIETTPRQCQNLTVSITGSGQPPYNLLVIPFGPTPLSSGKEVRKIIQQNFTSNSVTFQLNYPTDSQFVIQMSDQSGFGTGGATAAVTVLDSPDASCFDPDRAVQPGFFFSLMPNSLQQCSPTRFWWDPSAGVSGTPFFAGVIPGGQSLMIPKGPITQVPEQGTGYSWSPSVRAGTTLLIIAGDNRGLGSGGSSTYFVNNGDDSSCLDSNSPSSTPGSPAGGSYPTSTSGAGTGGGSSDGGSKHSNTGPIVGGVIGGVVGLVALLLVALFFWRRYRFHRKQRERPVDLLNEGDDHDGNPPQYYRPEPFIVPEPTAGSTTGETSTILDAARPSLDHRHSHYSALSGERSSTPDQTAVSGSTYMRKSPAPPSFRPVNIIQHDDAGPSEPETIELPPAYTNLRAGQKVGDEEHETSSTRAPTPPTEPSGPTSTAA